METFSNLNSIFVETLSSFGVLFMSFIPHLIGAIALMLIGWFIARIIKYVLEKILKKIQFDKGLERLQISSFLEKGNIKVSPSTIVATTVKWIVLLVFGIAAFDVLGWRVISSEFGNLLFYIPKIVSALLILVLGIYLARILRDFIVGLSKSIGVESGQLIGQLAFYFIIISITITALKQAGIKTDVLSDNAIMILGAILLAFSIAYGISAKDVLLNIYLSWYFKDKIKVGSVLTVNNQQVGKVVKIEGTMLFAEKANNTSKIISLKEMLNQNIQIKI